MSPEVKTKRTVSLLPKLFPSITELLILGMGFRSNCHLMYGGDYFRFIERSGEN
jgi:hypothetical protein